MAVPPSEINPLIRADLTKKLEIPVGEELAQEWGQVLGEIATWGAMLNELNGLQAMAQRGFTAALEKRSLLARQLNSARLSHLEPVPDNIIILDHYRQPESPDAA